MIQRVVTNQSKSIARGCKIEIMTLENWKIDLILSLYTIANNVAPSPTRNINCS